MTRRQIRCQRARELIPLYLDGALTLGERELLEAHLASCPLCTRELHNVERIDTRTRLALRSVVEEYSLSPQREAHIRRRLLSANAGSQRRWPRLNMSSLVAGIAAVLLVVSAGIATLRPTPPPREERGFVSYASAPPDFDLRYSETGRGRLQADPVTVTFLDSTLPESVYKPLVERFQASNPGVTVQVHRPDNMLTDPRFLADQATCFVGSADINSALGHDQLYSLTRMAQADARIHTDDFFPPLLQLVQVDGQLYGLPRSAQMRLAFFDSTILLRNNVPLPEAGWTSNEFARDVAQLRAKLPAEMYPFLPYDGYDAAYLLAQRGVNAPHSDNSMRLDANTTTAAIGWYADLLRDSASVAWALNDHQNIARRQQLAASYRVGIWMGPPAPRYTLMPSIGVVPLPTDEGRPGALQADAYFISKNASGTEAGACWRWIRYLSFQTFDWQRVPARISQVQDDTYVERYGKQQTKVILAALNNLAPIDPWTPTTVTALSDALDDVLRGTPPRNALLRVQRYLDSEWQ